MDVTDEGITIFFTLEADEKAELLMEVTSLGMVTVSSLPL